MKKHKNMHSRGKPVLFTILGLIGLGFVVAFLLKGTDVILFNPKGFIAGEQRRLMLFSVALMMELAVPVLFLLYFIAWKYSESHATATYDAATKHGKLFNFSIWAVPTVYMIMLASIMWPATHKLIPQKTLATAGKPLTIQVVALRWKWLFIYPEQHVASINYVQLPINTPVQFELTADDTPMSSFWIPHLGGQLYAMTGHMNRLNLLADTPGVYKGSSAEINGEGFAGMKFVARVGSLEDFDRWVQDTKRSPTVLDYVEYTNLLKPTENNPAAFYSDAEANLYDTILAKYMGSHTHQSGTE